MGASGKAPAPAMPGPGNYCMTTSISFETWLPGGYANKAVPRRADPASLQRLSGQTMGTTWCVRLDNPLMIPLEGIRATIEAALDLVVKQMSTWEPDSSITRFNDAPAGSRHVLEPEFAEVLACGLRWAASSEGALDPTIGSLVALWGFGARANPLMTFPSAAEIAAARARVGWQELRLDGETRTVTQPGGVWLDLSGIAKGFSVDRIVAALQALGFRDLFVEVGGEVRCLGRGPFGEPWQVTMDQSVRVALSDMAIAVSSPGSLMRERDGKRWSHMIDPRTGEPARNSLFSVTVIHPECKHADALATALTVFGLEDGLAFAQRKKVAALFVTQDGNRFVARATDSWLAQVHA